MTGCIYCIDNDILKKLATFDLFSQTVKLFDADHEHIKILPTATYKFRRDWEKVEKGRSRNSADKFVNYKKTIELAENLSQIAGEDKDIDLFTTLSQFEGIDEGEALLTSYVAKFMQTDKSPQALIFTGDKNFLRALATVDMPIIQGNLAHRLWCLEQLILSRSQISHFAHSACVRSP